MERILLMKSLLQKNFNKYFAEIGPKLAKNIQKSSINFESFMKTCDSTQAESALTINELKDVFFFHSRQTKVLAMTRLVLILLKIALACY